jgi:hypothetical protein
LTASQAYRHEATKGRSGFLQELYTDRDILLLVFGEAFPPSSEYVGIFDVPCHGRNMPYNTYRVKEDEGVDWGTTEGTDQTFSDAYVISIVWLL